MQLPETRYTKKCLYLPPTNCPATFLVSVSPKIEIRIYEYNFLISAKVIQNLRLCPDYSPLGWGLIQIFQWVSLSTPLHGSVPHSSPLPQESRAQLNCRIVVLQEHFCGKFFWGSWKHTTHIFPSTLTTCYFSSNHLEWWHNTSPFFWNSLRTH